VQHRRRLRAAGQNEGSQRGEGLVDLVARRLQPLDLLALHGELALAASRRQTKVGADVEEVVLDSSQPVPLALGKLGVGRQRDPDLGVELVDRSVGLDAGVRLRDPAHVAEMRLAVVAEAGVYAGEVDPAHCDQPARSTRGPRRSTR
jgi:hypothetical protein